MTKKAYVFPGQGSQMIGMGNELFDKYKDLVEEADNILGYSIEELCTTENDRLNQTEYTQPALYTVNAMMYYETLKKTESKPDYVAGHSLGEYNALLSADVFDFITGLKLVKKRGELMSKANYGAMSAVIGKKEEEVKALLRENKLYSLDIANLNSTFQIVLSGNKDDIMQAQSVFENAGVLNYSMLNVSGAFHSRYMQPAADEFKEYLEQFELFPPKIEVISNYTARPYTSNSIKENMYKQITNGVQWTKTICYLLDQQVEQIEQIGPGKVVSGLVRRIKLEVNR